MPGIIYLLNGKSPWTQWFIGAPQWQPIVGHFMHAGFRTDMQAPFIITEDQESPLLTSELRKVGIRFPEDYSLVGHADGTFIGTVGHSQLMRFYFYRPTQSAISPTEIKHKRPS